ncbi:LPXTG cell wall anchor domain-containing protein [Mediterraneibacter glycyrrhizinilyticus]|uniref:LPXTG cell wall anchor domain-containing protein n=1 Tax=Mediterraneibacter glycyrrhizinilyticus TaxID=342942 RepID=UPI0025A3DF6A|nr:LPXTG cell wall anchor domain-containing protein [Mediterraneibacter glycyrrhizinilyticus]MDM8209860.1 LPXTG cell wall anchor domain-containing protein [Mediterraneibacter glycyrrhizinilyticus]
MKKRLFGTFLAAALILTQAVTVFAAGSKTADVALSGESASYYEVAEASEEVFAQGGVTDETVLAKIMAVNAGTETLQSIAELAPELEEVLSDKEMITPFFDLSPVNGGIKTDDGKYLVTLSVPTLTEGMTDVLLLHYSTERTVWETVEPTDVDYASQEITAEFEDLSPVAVIANTDNAAAADSATGTSPQTGMSSGWMVWLGAAVVLAAAGAVTYRKAGR